MKEWLLDFVTVKITLRVSYSTPAKQSLFLLQDLRMVGTLPSSAMAIVNNSEAREKQSRLQALS
jgi:hypothetical protein